MGILLGPGYPITGFRPPRLWWLLCSVMPPDCDWISWSSLVDTGALQATMKKISSKYVCTPWQIKMEPANHPFRKEIGLPKPP